MATFAELDENNIVLNVIRVADEHCWDEDKNELESVSIAYLKSIYGDDTKWAKNSTNTYIEEGNHFGSGYLTLESGARIYSDGPHHIDGKPFRKQAAVIGSWFDEANDGFRAPKELPWCDPSFHTWRFDIPSWKWVAPKPMPDYKETTDAAAEGRFFWEWDEERKDWVIWKIPPEDRDGKEPDVIGAE